MGRRPVERAEAQVVMGKNKTVSGPVARMLSQEDTSWV